MTYDVGNPALDDSREIKELKDALYKIGHGMCGDEVSLDQSPEEFRHAMWTWSQHVARKALGEKT